MVRKIKGSLKLEPQSAEPTNPEAGQLFYDSDDNYLKVYDGTGFRRVINLADITEAQGQILYYDGSQWNALDPGTSGQFLKTQGAGANPVWDTVTIGNTWRLVEERIISTASTTEDFTGLNGDNDGTYMLEGRIVNDTASDSTVYVRLNQSDWGVNRQCMWADGTSVSAQRDTAAATFSVLANDTTSFIIQFPSVKTGEPRHAFAYSHYGSGTGIRIIQYYFHITTPSNTTNITAVGLRSDVTNGIGVNSVIRLWKRVT